MKKLVSILLTLAVAVSLSLVAVSPVAAQTNYSPFGSVLYIWGTDQGTQANTMKWFCLGGDDNLWDGHKITIVNSQWSDFNGKAYLKNTGTNERFTLWRDAGCTADQVTTTKNGYIGEMGGIPAAESIDGWVDFDPTVDTVGDPRETVGELSHMYYDSPGAGSGGGNLEVKLNTFGAPDSFNGRYLELVECGWEDINGGWYLKFVLDAAGTSGWYELYADAGFTEPGIPSDPAKFVSYGGTEGYLYANSGRFVEPWPSVGLDVDTGEGIVAISVSPTSIDFETVQPGQSSSTKTITVENIGYVPVDVSALVDPTGTVFDYLQLDGKKSLVNWGIDNLVGGQSQNVLAQLVVPREYSVHGPETATLVFEVSVA